MLSQWSHWPSGFTMVPISGCENLFFWQKWMPIRGMQNHDIHANGGMKTPYIHGLF